MCRFERLQKSFLNEVLSFGFVAAQQIGGTKQAVAMLVKRPLKIDGRRTAAADSRGTSAICYLCRRPTKGSIRAAGNSTRTNTELKRDSPNRWTVESEDIVRIGCTI
jgi:hypothetical protein